MVVGKILTKLIQTLPTWEVTKYYGRVCIFQLKCLKYRVQTSEAWFNFKCKFMPGSLRDELECEEAPEEKKLATEDKKKAGQKLLPKESSQIQQSMEHESDNRRSRSSSRDGMKQSYNDDINQRSRKSRSKAQREEYDREDHKEEKSVKVQKKVKQ